MPRIDISPSTVSSSRPATTTPPSSATWWYGEQWSIVDVYLYWVFSTAAKGAFNMEDYPALAAHAERVRARPSFQRALARERAAVTDNKLNIDASKL